MKLFNIIVVTLAATTSTFCQAKESSVRGLGLFSSPTTIEEEFIMTPQQDQETENMVQIRVTNQAYQQPFGGFFVMTHNADETPLFTTGTEASEALARLAEDGNPMPLVEAYNTSTNVGYVGIQNEGAPYFGGGEPLEFMVPFDGNYPYLTIASMAINTNDCFAALNRVKLEPGTKVMTLPGYDSGTEENNELCGSIPGPACAGVEGNVQSGNGEGFVHVHRGFFGVGDLPQSGYDWRNPMMRVEMTMM